jgi:hypothetical protein
MTSGTLDSLSDGEYQWSRLSTPIFNTSLGRLGIVPTCLHPSLLHLWRVQHRFTYQRKARETNVEGCIGSDRTLITMVEWDL